MTATTASWFQPATQPAGDTLHPLLSRLPQQPDPAPARKPRARKARAS